MNGFEITVTLMITLFSGAWIAFGVGWVIKTAKGFSSTSSKLE